jgi:hypothetical protein
MNARVPAAQPTRRAMWISRRSALRSLAGSRPMLDLAGGPGHSARRSYDLMHAPFGRARQNLPLFEAKSWGPTVLMLSRKARFQRSRFSKWNFARLILTVNIPIPPTPRKTKSLIPARSSLMQPRSIFGRRLGHAFPCVLTTLPPSIFHRRSRAIYLSKYREVSHGYGNG